MRLALQKPLLGSMELGGAAMAEETESSVALETMTKMMMMMMMIYYLLVMVIKGRR